VKEQIHDAQEQIVDVGKQIHDVPSTCVSEEWELQNGG
jgi:hypothetical protein